jgi:rod shape-determining protein MreB
MIVDVGGGTSEVAVISLGGIVVSRSIRVGGYEMDEALGHHMRGAHQLAIGSRSAEAIKLAIGSAHPLSDEMTFPVRGRHIVTGLPSEVALHSEEVREALRGPLREILSAITETLEQTPPELASDIARHGILLAGGGTLLRGLADLVEAETQIATNVAADALTCVAIGSGLALEHYDRLAGSTTAKRTRASRSTTT